MRTSFARYLLTVGLNLAVASAAVSQPFAPILEVTELDGSNGFGMSVAMYGSSTLVGSAGDVNGDGLMDVLVGNAFAFTDDNLHGEAYVVYGRDEPYPSYLDLAALDLPDGFLVRGFTDANERTADSVFTAGDVNGDGVDDFLIAAPDSSQPDMDGFCCYGQVYLIYGRNEFDRVFSLVDFSAADGVVFDGENPDDRAGEVVAGLGDVNGDGLADIGIGAEPGFGQVYVIFGSTNFAPKIDLELIDSTNGFIFATSEIGAGALRVAPAGDMNGDGLADIVIGATGADAGGVDNAGEAYVIFGAPEYPAGTIFPESLDGENGFVVAGSSQSDLAGTAEGAGDVNADGFDDLVVGAIEDSNSYFPGKAYVVFGSPGRLPPLVVLDDLDGSDGFRIRSEAPTNGFGWDTAGVGDVNGDGIDDFVIGATAGNHLAIPDFLPPIRNSDSLLDATGSAHVVFGSRESYPAEILVDDLDGLNGFSVFGVSDGSHLGDSVAGPGDINGDGLNDIVVGAPDESIYGFGLGGVYAIFGRSILEVEVSADACPGPGDVSIHGGTPGGEVGLITGQALGESGLPPGVCEELNLNLATPRLVRRLVADGNGDAVLSGNIPDTACGGMLQAVDLSACRKSAVIPLPAAGP